MKLIGKVPHKSAGRIQDSQQFKGEIDEVRLYKRALDVAELKALLAPGQLFVKVPPVKEEDLLLKINGREFSEKRRQPAFAVLRLPAGPVRVSAPAQERDRDMVPAGQG